MWLVFRGCNVANLSSSQSLLLWKVFFSFRRAALKDGSLAAAPANLQSLIQRCFEEKKKTTTTTKKQTKKKTNINLFAFRHAHTHTHTHAHNQMHTSYRNTRRAPPASAYCPLIGCASQWRRRVKIKATLSCLFTSYFFVRIIIYMR